MSTNTEQFFDSFSKEYDKKTKNSYFKRNQRWIVNEINKDKHINNKVIMDVGCGTGELLKTLYQSNNSISLIGVDISKKMLEKASKIAPSASLIKADSANIPVANNSVDIIVSSASFHHYENPKLVIKEWERILNTNGYVILLDSVKDYFPLSFMAHYWDVVDGKVSYSHHLKSCEFNQLFKKEFSYVTVSLKFQPLPIIHALIVAKKEKTND